MQYAAYETQPMVKWAQEVLRSGQRILEMAEKMQNNGRDMQALSREIFIFDHSTFKSHKYSSEHTSRILYVGRYFLNMEL